MIDYSVLRQTPIQYPEAEGEMKQEQLIIHMIYRIRRDSIACRRIHPYNYHAISLRQSSTAPLIATANTTELNYWRTGGQASHVKNLSLHSATMRSYNLYT